MTRYNRPEDLIYDYDIHPEAEGERLRIQAELLASVDKPIFAEIIASHPGAVVLDVGCNEGDSARDRLNGLNIGAYIGIDMSETAISKAREKYADENTHFFVLNAAENGADRKLADILSGLNTDKVDFICISFVLLHLSEPGRLLKLLYPFLAKGGVIFVRDIDDEDNLAVPDEDGRFKESYNIPASCRSSGNRTMGRYVPELLRESGYKNITCRVKGLSSAGSDSEKKQALWDIYFGFFREDSEQECMYTNGAEYALCNLGWCDYWLPRLYERFMEPDFEFTLGMCIYTAVKED